MAIWLATVLPFFCKEQACDLFLAQPCWLMLVSRIITTCNLFLKNLVLLISNVQKTKVHTQQKKELSKVFKQIFPGAIISINMKEIE